MLPIPKDSTFQNRFQALCTAIDQARKAIENPGSYDPLNTRFTRRDGMKAAGGSMVALAVSSPVALLSTAGETIAPQAGILMFMHRNWNAIYQISRYTSLGFGYLTYGMDKYELVRPEMLDDEAFQIAHTFFNFRHFISYSQTRKMPSSNELKELLKLLNYTTEEDRKEKREMLINMGLFIEKIESEIKAHCKHHSYEEARRIAEDRVLESIIDAAKKLDRNISMSKWLIKCIKKHAPHLEAQQTVLERIFTEGPDFLETNPWFQAKRAEINSRSQEGRKEVEKKEQNSSHKEDLSQNINYYRVLLRIFNLEAEKYDEILF